MFEQATIPVRNEKTFAEVQRPIEEAFAPAKVATFLGRVASAGLRVRQFEEVLARGYLGSGAQAAYGALGASDQGQIRELYLRKVEQVPGDVRQKYFRVYTGY